MNDPHSPGRQQRGRPGGTAGTGVATAHNPATAERPPSGALGLRDGGRHPVTVKDAPLGRRMGPALRFPTAKPHSHLFLSFRERAALLSTPRTSIRQGALGVEVVPEDR
jgi:hypothetical protein